MKNENVNIDGLKEANKRSFEALDELFAYPEEDHGDLDESKKMMSRFLDEVYDKMEKEGIDKHELSKMVNEEVEHIEDVLSGDVFFEWVLFVKLAHHLNIEISFMDRSSDH